MEKKKRKKSAKGKKKVGKKAGKKREKAEKSANREKSKKAQKKREKAEKSGALSPPWVVSRGFAKFWAPYIHLRVGGQLDPKHGLFEKPEKMT